ncbi:helix-turn-helix transcriptional regulator [Uliginosibacterium sp. H1]|uniref:helix-turn-helix transcriptional regulator n=1 Tax=Uliginosibacterium sp. H1 TaxID=3114757 RepID=UPI002E18D4F8|nr:AraC family transcriptional regulator [Uliginosibacterium sp. H1]
MGQCTREYRVLRPDVATEAPVLAGHLAVVSPRSGLQIKCTELRDLHDMTTEAELGECLSLVVLLNGHAEARFGDRQVRIGTRDGGADAALISLAEPERFVRRSQRGRYERKVGVTLKPEWFADSGIACAALDRFRREHLSIAQWKPSVRAQNIASQMIRPPVYANGLESLYLESRALELVADAMGRFVDAPSRHTTALDTRSRTRLNALREWLDSGAADTLNLDQIARHAGLNAHSLQQQFRAAFGSTIFEYQRNRRLDVARLTLETQAVSIAQAAWQAGYGSTANFATAFRRRFGLTPRQAQPRN